MREYYVIRLGRPQDTTKALPMAQQAEMQVPQPAPAREERARRPARLGDFDVGVQIGNAQKPVGYYVKPFDTTDKSGAIVHTSEEAAETFAREMAAKHPQVLFGVFSCVKVFETTEPNVVVKTFNDSNELIVSV